MPGNGLVIEWVRRRVPGRLGEEHLAGTDFQNGQRMLVLSQSGVRGQRKTCEDHVRQPLMQDSGDLRIANECARIQSDALIPAKECGQHPRNDAGERGR
ncbi:hypothetical protein ASD65_13120 [Microbacterium sp. Root61]|nr:hypothetical protein ASD65_13120 [Microbacterium sp. Root61]